MNTFDQVSSLALKWLYLKKWSMVKPSQSRKFTHTTLAVLSNTNVSVRVFRKIIMEVRVHRLGKNLQVCQRARVDNVRQRQSFSQELKFYKYLNEPELTMWGGGSPPLRNHSRCWPILTSAPSILLLSSKKSLQPHGNSILLVSQ